MKRSVRNYCSECAERKNEENQRQALCDRTARLRERHEELDRQVKVFKEEREASIGHRSNQITEHLLRVELKLRKQREKEDKERLKAREQKTYELEQKIKDIRRNMKDELRERHEALEVKLKQAEDRLEEI